MNRERMIGTPQRAQDSPLVIHAHQLIQLDRLMAEGRGDSVEADALRDQMDESWYRMNSDDLDIARQVSADLYTLHDDTLVRHPRDFSVYSPGLAAELSYLMTNGQYLRALRLMQDRSSEISVERAALFRAILYRAMGLPDVARKFFEQVSPPAEESRVTSLPLMGFLWQHMNIDTAVIAASTGQFASPSE
ncbi:MAG: hypothetical protein AB7G28_10680 [Pirellulales bacterium]